MSWITWSQTAFLDSRRHLRSIDWTSGWDVAQSLRLPGSVVAVLPWFTCITTKLEKKPEETVLVYSNSTFLPLQLQLEMVRSRDVRCLSFPLTVTTLLTSTSWLLYGLQVSDLYIVVRLAYSCPTFNTARNIELSWLTEMLSLFVSGPKLPRNHHQPHQILSLLEVWIFSFRFTFLQAHAHMRWGGVWKGHPMGIKG